jgi:tetratricopeptide (TPR) repeat protein
MKPALILLLILLAAVPYLAAQAEPTKYFLPENILRFAESLYQEGDYLRAAGEFQRYLYSFDALPDKADAIIYKIGLCYKKGNDFEKSAATFRKLLDLYPQSPLAPDSYCEIGYSYFLMKSYDRSMAFLSTPMSFNPNQDLSLKVLQLRGLNYLYKKQWNAAAAYFHSLEPPAKKNSLTQTLLNFSEEGWRLPRKSQFLAGFLSAIIPGAGKIYSRRTADGLASLVTVGLTAWQAYEGFHKDGVHSTKGWIYGTLSAFFYVGNIYGSVVSVNIYNEHLENALLEKIGIAIHVAF